MGGKFIRGNQVGTTNSTSQIRDDLVNGKRVTCDPGQIDALMRELAGGPPVDLALLHVTGPGNEFCFDRPLRNIPREQMPQLHKTVEELKGFTDRLAGMGVTTKLESVDPRTLRMTQNQLTGSIVGSIYEVVQAKGLTPDTVVVVSKEGAVLDGHHRWAAVAGVAISGTPIKLNVLRVDLGIDDLLGVANEMSRPRKAIGQLSLASAAQPSGPPPNPSEPWLWIDGRWLLVATDTSDGVPESLDFVAST